MSIIKLSRTVKIHLYEFLLSHIANKKIDLAIVGYPKCGNTWVGMLVRGLIIKHYGLEYNAIERVVPNNLKQVLFYEYRNEIPCAFMTHNMPWFLSESYKSNKIDFHKFRNKKVAILIREPKDALVSLYMHVKYRSKVFSGSIEEFVASEVLGIEKYIDYYRKLYDSTEMFDNFDVIRYEEMHSDPILMANKIISLLAIPYVSEETILAAIKFASFDNMKKMESEDAINLPSMKRPIEKCENALKVRKGTVGGFVDELPADLIKLIDEKIASSGLAAIFKYQE